MLSRPATPKSSRRHLQKPLSPCSHAHKPDGAVFGWFAGSVLQGVVGVQRERSAKLAHKAFVWGMYVVPEARRAGAGRKLHEHAFGYVRSELGVRQVNLGVNTQNQAAFALYRRVGFEVYGTEREFCFCWSTAWHTPNTTWSVECATLPSLTGKIGLDHCGPKWPRPGLGDVGKGDFRRDCVPLQGRLGVSPG